MLMLQFHYGQLQLKIHEIGMPIEWGDGSPDTSGQNKVEILAYSEPCRQCGFDDEFMYVITIDSNVISGFRLASEEDLERLEW